MKKMQLNVNLIKETVFCDIYFIVILMFITGVGLLTLTSASTYKSAILFQDGMMLVKRQIMWAVLAFVSFLIPSLIPLKFWRKNIQFIMGLTFVLLIAVFLPYIGLEINNARRWITVFGFNFQPSELAKISSVLYLAYIFSKYGKRISELKFMLPKLTVVFLIILLIFIEPDFSTSVQIFFLTIMMYFLSSGSIKNLIIISLILLLLIFLVVNVFGYGRARMESFFHQWRPGGAANINYQVNQSYKAIQSGGLWGKGLGNSFFKSGYLPEAHTDFIFAIFIEEFGLMGAAALIALYLFLIFAVIKAARTINDDFYLLFFLGLGFLIITQAFANMAIILGLLPTTGITLPFVSYGGTSLIISAFNVGLMVKITANFLPEKRRKRNV